MQAKVTELVERIRSDEKIRAAFQKNPVQALETLLGVDLPDEQLQAVLRGVQAKLNLDGLGEKLSGLLGKK